MGLISIPFIPIFPLASLDPEYSINVVFHNLADCLLIAQFERPMDAVKLVLSGNKYGQGYITLATNKFGEYFKANAIAFSMKTEEQYGRNSYGDKYHVPHVLRYYPLGQIFYDPETSSLIVEVARSQIGNVVGGLDGADLVGIVERVENGRVYTIEGNTADSCREWSYP